MMSDSLGIPLAAEVPRTCDSHIWGLFRQRSVNVPVAPSRARVVVALWIVAEVSLG